MAARSATWQPLPLRPWHHRRRVYLRRCVSIRWRLRSFARPPLAFLRRRSSPGDGSLSSPERTGKCPYCPLLFRMNAPLKLFAGGNRFMKMYTTINQKQSLIGFLCCSWKGCVGIDYWQGRGWNIITYWKYNTTISTDESFHASYNELENKKLNYSIGYGLSNSYVAGIREKMIWLRCLRAVVDGVNKIMSEIFKNRVKITYLFKLIWTQESRCCQIIWI